MMSVDLQRNQKEPEREDANHGLVSARAAIIALFMLIVPVINYFLNLVFYALGISIISAETLQKLPFIPIKHELARMEHSRYYSQYVDAYAGFMAVIMLLFAISTLLIGFLLLRRIGVILRITKNQELESVSWFCAMLIFYAIGSYLWVFEWNSVFFNANSKTGNNYYWFSTLLISIPWVFVPPLLILFVSGPKLYSHSIFEQAQKKEMKNG